ncbi:hypothetical protein LJC59_06195 [Desulfovibrio sp. OttesenSCG-928-A18]|nr:hypothetical protein [Desulfovibrio sp. OttesenSCG-928-A18]
MGMGYHVISLLQRLAQKIRRPEGGNERVDLGVLGYQELLLHTDEVKELLPREKIDDAPVRIGFYSSRLRQSAPLASISLKEFQRDAYITEGLFKKKIKPKKDFIDKYHIDRLSDLKKHIRSGSILFESNAFFASIGFTHRSLDITQHVGDEIVCDLNLPVDNSLHGAFDITVDGGTIEHCFNVPQALANMVHMTRAGGAVFHVSPVSWPNHGFYNFNPCLFHEFYSANGFSTVYALCGFNAGMEPLYEVSLSERFPLPPERTILFFGAIKNEHVQNIKWPIQGVYANKPAMPKGA